jgi:ABC-type uncharacterized transport system ATPase subunit
LVRHDTLRSWCQDGKVRGVLTVDGLSVAYGGLMALADISLAVEEGQFERREKNNALSHPDGEGRAPSGCREPPSPSPTR